MSNNKIVLKKHQKLPVEFMKNNRGLLLYHSTGSGKTLTALYSMYQFDKPIIIIGPKSSRKAFTDNINKANLDIDRVTFFTYTKMKMLLDKNIELLSNTCVILDEAHHLRSETSKNLLVISALDFAYKVILLTATPIINYPNDLAVLINIVKNKSVLPTDVGLFNSLYYDDVEFRLKNTDIFQNKIKDAISYYKMKDDENYPKSEVIIKDVVMNNEQLDEYIHYVKKFIYDLFDVENPFNIDFTTLDKRKKNYFLTATRQLSNTVGDDIIPEAKYSKRNKYSDKAESPKIKAIFETVRKGPFPCVVYSNFLKRGVYEISKLLEISGIIYKTITGGTSDDKINQIVNAYNSGKFQVLLISSAASESLDLKNTRQIHIMEPHWNEPKITQIIGRAIRYKSHEDLPVKDRNVKIYRWVSVFPENIFNKSADQYLTEISEYKDKIFQDFEELIKESSIENYYDSKGNIIKQKGGMLYLNHHQKYVHNKIMYSNL